MVASRAGWGWDATTAKVPLWITGQAAGHFVTWLILKIVRRPEMSALSPLFLSHRSCGIIPTMDRTHCRLRSTDVFSEEILGHSEAVDG